MTPQEWERIVELFERARGLAEAERRALLEAEEAEQPEIVEHVRRLLAADPPDEFVTPPQEASGTPAADVLFGGGLAGARVGDFVLREEIGRGGMGVVYRADQLRLDRSVAVKILPLAKIGQGQALERFRREAKAASTLAHAHIANVLAYGEGDSTAWYAMRFVDGHDLAREIREQRKQAKGEPSSCLLPAFDNPAYVSTIVQRVIELAGALHHAHENGIVHRDVKPQNILLNRAGELFLVDFGLALDERFGALSVSGELRGTPHYMSPEQVRASRSRVDRRMDVYSMGIVLYELLGLRRPYEGRTNEEVLSGIVRQEPEPVRSLNPRIPRDLALICEKAMEKEPDRRYPTGAELADDLRRFLRHEAVLAKPPTIGQRLQRKLRAHRQALQVAGLLVATVALGLVFAQWKESRAADALRPRVSLLLAHDAETGAPLDERVELFVRPIDPVREQLAPWRLLGELPVDLAPLQPGRYLFAVRAEGFAPSELVANLEAGERPLELMPRLAPDASAREGMVRVEGGTLALGADRPLGCLGGAEGALDVEVAPFWLDEDEVTNGEFLAFLEASGHPVPDYWRRAGYETSWEDLPVEGYRDVWRELPVVGVSWFDAVAFASWHGKRLVTHPEAEFAFRDVSRDVVARGEDATDGRPRANVGGRSYFDFPGSDWRRGYRLYLEEVLPARAEGYRQGALGLFHAFANVDEFTLSPFVERVEGKVVTYTSKALFYGGSWSSNLEESFRHNAHAQIGVGDLYSSNHIGFRCARSADLQPGSLPGD